MNILLTGLNSFTGLALSNYILSKGNNLFALTSGKTGKLSEDQKKLFNELKKFPNFNVIKYSKDKPIASQNIDLPEKIDILFIHGFDVKEYKSKLLDPMRIAYDSVVSLEGLPLFLKEKCCHSICYTGTYFRNANEVDYTPYTISKSLCWDYIRFIFSEFHLLYYLFPNPIGFGQSRGLTYEMLRNWSTNLPYRINFPIEIRDNIPVDILVEDYYKKAINTFSKLENQYLIFSPSYFLTTNINFANLIKKEVLKRYPNFKCKLEIGKSKKNDIIQGFTNIRNAYLHKEDRFWDSFITSYFETS